MRFGEYIRCLVKITLSSFLSLAVPAGIALLLYGRGNMHLDVDFDFGAFDGLWLMLGLPLVALLVFLILSPFSYVLYGLLSRRGRKNARSESPGAR